MSIVRDLPPVSGSIVWAKQIDRQLTAYLRRVEDVLGKHFLFCIFILCSENCSWKIEERYQCGANDDEGRERGKM